jgi:hypothetical protein
MKYELIKFDIGKETNTDEQGNYSVNITIALHPTDGIAADFSKDINVTSNNSQTGFEVDAQRQEAVNAYVAQVNQ